jgi:NAD(P)-dependent dehydrogenase (short-subunit alcohol dehydrogenase family)
MDLQFDAKVVLVNGAASGIGATRVRGLSLEGCGSHQLWTVRGDGLRVGRRGRAADRDVGAIAADLSSPETLPSGGGHIHLNRVLP